MFCVLVNWLKHTPLMEKQGIWIFWMKIFNLRKKQFIRFLWNILEILWGPWRCSVSWINLTQERADQWEAFTLPTNTCLFPPPFSSTHSLLITDHEPLSYTSGAAFNIKKTQLWHVLWNGTVKESNYCTVSICEGLLWKIGRASCRERG